MAKFTAKETRILDNLFLFTDCKTEQQARQYIDDMYTHGMTVDDIYTYFVTMAPSYI